MGIEEEPVETGPDPADLAFEGDQRFEDNVIEMPRKHTKTFGRIAAEQGQRKSVDMPKNEAWIVGELVDVDIKVPWSSSLQVELAHDCQIIAEPESKVGVLGANSTYELVQNGATTVFGKSARIDGSETPPEEESDEIALRAA